MRHALARCNQIVSLALIEACKGVPRDGYGCDRQRTFQIAAQRRDLETGVRVGQSIFPGVVGDETARALPPEPIDA